MSTKRNQNKRKSLFNFICPCILSKKQSDDLNEQNYVLIDENDKYEYVVEKLAIKKVPLSVFGTEDDYNKPVNDGRSNDVRIGTKVNQLFPIGRDVVNYQSYFAQMRHRNRSSPSRIETTTSTSSDDNNNNINNNNKKKYCPRHGDLSKLKKPVDGNEEHKEIISNILSKYSSLYTLDEKETVPKDPLTFQTQTYRPHSPTCPTVMKPNIEISRVPVNDYPLPKHHRHTVEIHEPPQEENADRFDEIVRTSMPPLPGGMTKQMRQTINALGMAQPFTKKMVPRNNRCPSPPVRDDPLQNIKMYQSNEVRCVSYENDPIKPLQNNNDTLKISTKRNDYDEQRQGTHKKYDDTNSSSKQESYFTDNKSSNNTNNYLLMSGMSYQSLPKVIEEETSVVKLASNLSGGIERNLTNSISEQSYTTVNKETGSKYNSDEPIMEINHMKGKNLKWKIIIKHHDDDKKRK